MREKCQGKSWPLALTQRDDRAALSRLNKASLQASRRAAESAAENIASWIPRAANDSLLARRATSSIPVPIEGPKCLTPQSPAGWPPDSQLFAIDSTKSIAP